MQKTCEKQDQYATVAAWNRVSKEICTLLCEDDINELKENRTEFKAILQKKVTPYLSPDGLEYFGRFLQGGIFVDDLLSDFFDVALVHPDKPQQTESKKPIEESMIQDA